MRHLGRVFAACVLTLCATACGPTHVDHTPTSNLLDADSATFEDGVGEWVAWFSSRISREPDAAKTGASGLKVEVTDPYGWGIQLDNWPGFEASPGLYRASFWARAPAGHQEILLEVAWRDENGEELQVDALTSEPLDAEWTRIVQEVTAPKGTTRVGLMVTGDEGEPGEVVELDAFLLQPAPP